MTGLISTLNVSPGAALSTLGVSVAGRTWDKAGRLRVANRTKAAPKLVADFQNFSFVFIAPPIELIDNTLLFVRDTLF
jgi:hypothetical protein